MALDPWLREYHQIHHQYSNVDEQEQNGMAEKFGDMIVKGVHAMLLQSNLGTEFWGAAALYWVETHNHLQHL